jgi:Signal transduction histidine kinase regulating C4-dicarboxylate transport system
MSPGRVLFVDDEQGIARLCQYFLASAAFETMIATDSRVAFELIQSQKFDLLLSDIQMPFMDGFQLLEMGKKYQPGMAVLFMTAYGTVETAIRALRYGADGLILKPFGKGSELIEAANQALQGQKQKRDAARLQVLRPLFDTSETLIAETDSASLGKLILDSIGNSFQARYVSIHRKMKTETEWSLMGEIGEPLPWDAATISAGLIGALVGRGAPIFINQTGPGNVELQGMLKSLNIGSMIVAPLSREQGSFIFIAARDANGQPFTESDLEMLMILTRQAVVAMENARLYSDLRNYVRRVEESQRALIQAEKMAALGRVMASVAHEVNNPLQSVRNCLYLATRQDVSPEQQKSYIDLAQSEVERLTKTVRQMLEFYRPGGTEKVQVSVVALVEKVLKLLHVQLEEKGIQIHENFPQPGPTILAVPDQLQQVFFNIILNAMDAMEENKSPKNLWIDISSLDKQVEIVLEDSGPGIPSGKETVIFEPFVSTKKEGTGLGLAISYGITEAHGGKLKVIDPRYGLGASFAVTLPI